MSDTGAVERAARAILTARHGDRAAAASVERHNGYDWRAAIREARAALAAAAPTVADIVDAIHGHPVKAAPYLGVWECTCGAPIRGMREQAERVAALWGAR